MSPLDKKIEQPLGQNLKAGKSGAGRRILPRFGATLAALSIAAIAGLAAYTSLYDRGFRKPDVTAEVTVVPETDIDIHDEPEDEIEVGSIELPEEAPSPSIIKVDPDPEPSDNVIIIRDPSAIGQNLRIAHLPDKALIENSSYGTLPRRAEDGRRPFDVYARPWSGARGARVAIVIGGLGLSQTGTQSAIEKLPGEVTLAFAPHGNSIGRWMTSARRSGHEILMQVPLEPFDYPAVNPGSNTLTVDAGDEKNLANLRWALGRTTNYTGVMNYMGARFVSSPVAMEPMMIELGKRGLLYLDDGTSARSLAPQLAPAKGVPLASGDAVIDASKNRGEILKKLDELERIARAKGYALGTGSAFDVTVDAVASWVNEAKKRGIEIVPVSALASDPERK
ncbi:MAG: divergent polysaccharide deacetylase family protein [Rhizobiaceae bacterium]